MGGEREEHIVAGGGAYRHWREAMTHGFEHTGSRLWFSTPQNVALTLGRLGIIAFLRGGCPRGGGNWETLRIPREDWGILGNIEKYWEN